MMSSASIILRFVCGGGWDSKLIRYWTECEWSHVEAVEGHRTFGAQLKGGVTWRDFSDPCYRHLVKSVEVRLACTPDQEQRFWDFLRKQDGKPYDTAAIASFSPVLRLFIHDRDWLDQSAWFCSELILAALCAAGLVVIPEDSAIASFSPAIAWVIVAQLRSA